MKDFDPEMKYCPRCKDEYRWDFKTCAACNVDLLPGTMMREQSENQVDGVEFSEITGDDIVTPLRKGALREMKNLQRYLRKAGIPSMLVADSNCGGGCCGPEVLLQVRVEDTERAAQAVEKEHLETTHRDEVRDTDDNVLFNPFASQAKCPACGHVFQPNRNDCPECGLFFA